ncbi:MAG: ABC transporter ATP-binding protein [Sphingobium sp.]|nr:ABC transporter ATP-binding protein [Sphingobium sp.]
MTALTAKDVAVRRNGRAIVDAVSLRLESGMFVALLGPNGAGKSTLLSCLAGLVRPDEGSISLDDSDLTAIGLKALARRRAFLPQSPRAEWPVSVERLVALGLTPQLPAFGGLPAEMTARVADMLAQVDLTVHRDQPATTLSGGELACAMLARAMVGDPDILLIDEPLTGLDPRHALDGIARLRALADAGKLVLASMHDLTLAARHASHVAVMREGRLAAFGETATTLTAALLRDVFEVDVRISAAGTATATVDFLPRQRS